MPPRLPRSPAPGRFSLPRLLFFASLSASVAAALRVDAPPPSTHSPTRARRISASSPQAPTTPVLTRRLAAAALLSTVCPPKPSFAFANGIADMKDYASRRKYPGARPELGLQSTGTLKRCESSAPNCFSTTADPGDPNDPHKLAAWQPPSKAKAMSDVVEVIKNYPPGQNKVDKGGWEIVTSRPDYLYVQFESLKRGFIDDLEIAVPNDGPVQVRSSSRIGFLDLGVNSKRLNYISSELRSKGWIAPEITSADYPDYYRTIL